MNIRKIAILLFAVGTLMSYTPLNAQKKNKITKITLGEISPVAMQTQFFVNYGDFKVDYNSSITDYRQNNKNRYFVIARDASGKVLFAHANVFLNFNQPNRDYLLLQAGYDLEDFVVIEKRYIPEKPDDVECYLFRNGFYDGPYDTIQDVFPDGIVVKNRGICMYHKFGESEASLARMYVCAYKEEYGQDVVNFISNGKKVSFKPKNKVDFQKSANKQYCLSYHDDLMDNTLLVVDSIGYELPGDSKPIFSFSHNGMHWITATNEVVMVDGVVVNKEKLNVTKVLVKNNGSYAFLTEGEDMSDKIYSDENVLIENVDVKSLSIDDEERLIYIVKGKLGFFYCIDNEVTDMDDVMRNNFFPTLQNDIDPIYVVSDDGTHTFEYNPYSPFVVIDGKELEMINTVHSVHWNEKLKSFEWNYIENNNLMVIRYRVE